MTTSSESAPSTRTPHDAPYLLPQRIGHRRNRPVHHGLIVARSNALQYHEGVRDKFGLLRIIHLYDLFTIETQVTVNDGNLSYGMRLGWKKGIPPLTGELVSLHLPHSKIPVRVVRVSRTCLCCTHGVVRLQVEQVPGILADPMICDCSKQREMQTAETWRDMEVPCPRRHRAVLHRVSEIIEGKRR